MFKSRPRAPLKGAPVAQVSRKGVSRFARSPSFSFGGGEEIAFFARAKAGAQCAVQACSLPLTGALAVLTVPRHPRSAGGEEVRYFDC